MWRGVRPLHWGWTVQGLCWFGGGGFTVAVWLRAPSARASCRSHDLSRWFGTYLRGRSAGAARAHRIVSIEGQLGAAPRPTPTNPPTQWTHHREPPVAGTGPAVETLRRRLVGHAPDGAVNSLRGRQRSSRTSQLAEDRARWYEGVLA